MSDAGKGHKRRPQAVSEASAEASWERTFGPVGRTAKRLQAHREKERARMQRAERAELQHLIDMDDDDEPAP